MKHCKRNHGSLSDILKRSANLQNIFLGLSSKKCLQTFLHFGRVKERIYLYGRMCVCVSVSAKELDGDYEK
jgi:hypothetical protein